MPSSLQHFAASEFRHLDLCHPDALRFLDNVRDRYGASLVLTSDARTPAENAAASGSSPTSLHLAGRAFDGRWTFPDDAALWRFVSAVFKQQEVVGLGVELELVRGPTDRHWHLGLFADARPSRLVLALD